MGMQYFRHGLCRFAGLAASLGSSDELLVKLSAMGQPYPTHGVKRALWCTARWLQTRHPSLAVRNESLGLAPPATPWPREGAEGQL